VPALSQKSCNYNHLIVLSTFSLSNLDPSAGWYTKDSCDLKISHMSLHTVVPSNLNSKHYLQPSSNHVG